MAVQHRDRAPRSAWRPIVSTSEWCDRLRVFTDISSTLLDDPHVLASLLVAVGGAMGTSPLAPPIVKRGTDGLTGALLCNDGHVVVQTLPGEGRCLVSMVVRADRAADRGLDVIMRRFAVADR